MLYLDPRVGSGELLEYFKPYDVDIEDKEYLAAADIAWWGNGVDYKGDETPVMIGAERKILTDMIASMRSNRLSGFQLGRLLDNYKWVYLILEGIWRPGPSGEIQVKIWNYKLKKLAWGPLLVGHSPILFRELDHYLATLEHRVGVEVVRTADKEETAAWVVSRYKWWQESWYRHDSFEAIYAPYEDQRKGRRGAFSMPTIGAVEVVAAQFPGVGKSAFDFGRAFRCVHEMVNAEEGRLAGVEIKQKMKAGGVRVVKLGAAKAKSIHNWLRGIV